MTAAIQEAGLRAQIAATEQVIALERESLSVLRRELALGAIAEGDVFAQEAALAQLEATLAAPAAATAATTGSVGRADRTFARATSRPCELRARSTGAAADLPLGCPRNWSSGAPMCAPPKRNCTRRPRRSASPSPNLLPQFTITGNIGSAATAMSDLFKPGTGFWSIGAECRPRPCSPAAP